MMAGLTAVGVDHDLEQSIGKFVDDCYDLRYHESVVNLTPADVNSVSCQSILLEKRFQSETIKT